MTTDELGSSLQRLLSTLKKNRENVPLVTLKTYYQKPYEALKAQITAAATAFVKSIVLSDLPANPDADIAKQMEIIQRTITSSGMEGRMSHCMSRTYDVRKLQQMALDLRRQVEHALWPYTAQKNCLVADPANLEAAPVIYNTLTKKAYENGGWIEKDLDLAGKLLIYPVSFASTQTTPRKETSHGQQGYQSAGSIPLPVTSRTGTGLPEPAAVLLE